MPPSHQSTAQVTSQNDYDFSCGSRRSKGVPIGYCVFLRLLVGGWGPPNVPKFSLMANGYTHSASDLDQRFLETRNSEDGCTLPQISSPLPPKSPQNPILGDLSMQSLLYTELSVSRTLMELQSWNFTVIWGPPIFIGKYLGMGCQIFSARARPGGGRRAP